ncbi:MAG: OmpH family outer membrane protein [Bdellovibrionales bacterium]
MRYLLVISAILFSFSLQASLNLAYVDMQKALQATKAGKQAKASLEKEFKKKEAEFKRKDAELKKMGEDIQKKAVAWSEDQKRKKTIEFQQKRFALQQEVARSQQQISVKERELTIPIFKGLRDEVAKLAKEKKYSMVLEKSEQSVLYAEKKLDITDEVVKRFEKNSKK